MHLSHGIRKRMTIGNLRRRHDFMSSVHHTAPTRRHRNPSRAFNAVWLKAVAFNAVRDRRVAFNAAWLKAFAWAHTLKLPVLLLSHCADRRLHLRRASPLRSTASLARPRSGETLVRLPSCPCMLVQHKLGAWKCCAKNLWQLFGNSRKPGARPSARGEHTHTRCGAAAR